uniref:NADH-ubiquinone oxidoreductase chain 4L n=1 Tax=Etisus dentatus TaxID=903656 RepID=A0A7S8FIK3_9EUCA|nr:NADH dehydrogenase subunit 4L [Etisus dentatus]QPD06879.1 NADH dehydrogenase subunit 4L [Etisus dentatus]
MMNFSVISVFGSLFMVLCGLWSFISYHKHLLNSLLSLEFMMLGVFWLLSSQMTGVGSEIYFSLFFLTLAACEGALGLSLLVHVVRSHGSDRFMSLNLLEC